MDNTKGFNEEPVDMAGIENIEDNFHRFDAAVADDTVADDSVTAQAEEPEQEPLQQEPEQLPEQEPEPPIDYERLIAEAEERGYRRGRNESIAELMEQPSSADPMLATPPTGSAPEILILNNIRPSIWE